MPLPHRVAVLVRDGVLAMELGIAHRIFGQARDADGARLYEVATCAVRPGTVRTDGDVGLTVEHGPDLLADADTVVVPATDADDTLTALDPELEDALSRRRPGARLASICTGSFVLAAAGLLDGRRATTHWRSSTVFAERFPAVALQPDVLYTDDDGVLTSAGVASGIDLCLHMVRQDHGAAVANEVARLAVVPPHRDGGQAQFIRRPLPDTDVSPTGRARQWAVDHLERPITLADLAAAAGTSTRTLTRRFREETGTSPTQWVARRRLESACELLETSDLTVEEVAARCGYGTAASLRLHMREVLGVSPRAYRRTFLGV
jgi:transcriptional regulator GlxA family with amidase domain